MNDDWQRSMMKGEKTRETNLTKSCPSCGYDGMVSPTYSHGKMASGHMVCPRCDHEGIPDVDWEKAEDLMQPGERGGGFMTQTNRQLSKSQFR